MSLPEAIEVERRAKPYAKRSMYRFQGFCQQIDAQMLQQTLVFQTKHRIYGSVAEIGVWHGKSFFILAKSRTGDEKALAIDLFASRPLVKGERQQIDEFEDNCRAAGVLLGQDEILKGDSLSVTADDVLGRVGKVRLFHVDGAHDYEHALHDIGIARGCLDESGVIVVDDVFNRQWPEVTAAFCDWIRQNRDFAPWAITKHKLYMSRRQNKNLYETMVRNEFRLQIGRYTSLFGDEVFQLDQSLSATLLEKAMTKLLTPRQVRIPKAV